MKEEFIIPQDKLTQPDKDLVNKINSTFPGSAHWAGTGPIGTTCRECVSFDFHGYFSTGGGLIKPAACLKYKQMMNGKDGPKIPHEQKSCKYFTKGEKIPPIQKGRV